MKSLFPLIAILLLFAIGCQQPLNESPDFKMADEESIQSDADESEDVGEGVIERKLIKDGRVEFETPNIDSTRKYIFAAIEKYKAYTSSDQEYKSSGRISNTIVVRVPAKDFDNLLSDATQGVDKFEFKEVQVKDVTEEFLDIQARLKTKKELEARYSVLLNKANTVTEMLEVEKQMGELRSEIESIEGRLKYLENRVSLSTLTLTFYELTPEATAFGKKFSNGFKNGWENLIWFFVFLVNIWPFILIGIGLIVGFRYWRKRR